MTQNWAILFVFVAGISFGLTGCSSLQSPSLPETESVTVIAEPETPAPDLCSQQPLLEQQIEQLTLLQQQFEAQQLLQTDRHKQLLALAKNKQKILALSSAPVSSSTCNVGGKIMLGATEWLWLKPAGKALRARIDTGAATSSLSTTNIEKFERDGKRWVRFQLIEEGQPSIEIESRLLRTVKIRQASMEEGERRYVVRLPVQLGEFVEEAEFTLADRANMSYPILLGREFLRDVALVDVAKKYLQPKPNLTPSVVQVPAGTAKNNSLASESLGKSAL